MGIFNKTAAAGNFNTAGEDAMETGKLWSTLPLKEQGLARAIVRGFAAELELDRRLRGIQ